MICLNKAQINENQFIKLYNYKNICKIRLYNELAQRLQMIFSELKKKN